MSEMVTARLRLRRARLDDAAALHRVFADPQAMRFWSTPPHADLAQTEAWVANMAALAPADGDDFVLEYEGEAVGKAGFWRFPEIGFILRPDLWGRGLAREALEAVIDHGFRRRGLTRVTADVDPRNLACLGLLERLGFRETGRAARTWKVGEEWCDSIYLELAAPAS